MPYLTSSLIRLYDATWCNLQLSVLRQIFINFNHLYRFKCGSNVERIEERYYYIFNFHYMIFPLGILFESNRVESSRARSRKWEDSRGRLESRDASTPSIRVEIEIGLFKYAEPMKFAIIIKGTIYE